MSIPSHAKRAGEYTLLLFHIKNHPTTDGPDTPYAREFGAYARSVVANPAGFAALYTGKRDNVSLPARLVRPLSAAKPGRARAQ